MAPKTPAQQVEALVKERDLIVAKAQWIERSIANNATIPLSQIKVTEFLSIITDSYKKSDDIHEKIHSLADAADIAQHNLDYEVLMERLLEAKEGLQAINAVLNPLASSSSTTTATTSSTSTGCEIRLPRLELPSFSGNLQDWMTFSDLFKSAVHNNNNLSKAQKFTYLKSALSGDAARQIRSMQLTDANYDIAWIQLEERYQNERELLFAILRRLFSQPNVNPNSSSSIRSLIDVTKECIRSLQVLRRPVDHWDDILLYQLFIRIDPVSRQLWEQSLVNSKIPTFQKFVEFLESRARALAAGETGGNRPALKEPIPPKRVHHANSTVKFTPCKLCQSNHFIFRCPRFTAMTVNERTEYVKKNNMCLNCLREGHTQSKCINSKTCFTCHGKHHTLLHRTNDEQSTSGVNNSTAPVLNFQVSLPTPVQQVLLATALIRLTDCNQNPCHFRALLDGGSNTSFISEACFQSLGLRRSRATTNILGLSSTHVGTTRGSASIQVKPHFNSTVSYNINVFILRRVTDNLPSQPCDITPWTHLRGLTLADPTFYTPAPIDLLIGADLFWNLLQDGRITGPLGTPTASRSTLGWLVAGNSSSYTDSIRAHFAETSLDTTLQKFWEVESVPTVRLLTPTEKLAEQHFEETYQRNPDGKFILSLPYLQPTPQLGSSKEIAHRRFLQLERRLAANPDYKSQYIQFMQEYIQLNHMREIRSDEANHNPQVYIPHHFVLKESSTTTKFRVVFDASAKTTSGNSFNDTLMVGPVIQDNLTDIILRFRINQIAFTADIAKMYRQILIKDEDVPTCRILWREDPSHPIKEYCLLTVTYGTACAPYVATKTLQTLANLEAQNFPLASEIALRDFYVDDLLSGANTEEQAMQIQPQLVKMLGKGGFVLRKWSSNSAALMESIPKEMREVKSNLEFASDQTIKALGISWNTTTDTFQYTVHPGDISTPRVTKRMIVSEISKLFDPLGWISPIIISMKIYIQTLWKKKLGWDEVLDEDTARPWYDFQSQLKSIEKISIPRCCSPATVLSRELVGFSDASELAYAAVVYLRSKISNDNYHVSILTSKTRVAPVKSLSIPRLELCGAKLLAELMSSVSQALSKTINIEQEYAFTDSTIVLGWLNSSPSRWTTFVANRVCQIQELISSSSWSHVSSSDNPADLASRGISPADLADNKLWWNGPDFLSYRPLSKSVTNFTTDLEEKKPQLLVHHLTTDQSLLHRFSSLPKLIRVTALLRRFIFNHFARSDLSLKQMPARIIRRGPLTAEELDEALTMWIRIVQHEVFHKEIPHLIKGNQLSGDSRLRQLTPFLDSDSILRVGGRLQNSQLSHDAKHPMLLPRHHKLTELIVAHYHVKYLHAGPQLLLSLLTKRFWIIRGRDAVRHQTSKCVTCTRHNATAAQQMMGNLPSSRLIPQRPFLQCGVDYAGPFLVKPSYGRSKVLYKAYLCLFVCFTTRAIHLEVVSSLDTSSFLATFRRFVARRGKPAVMHSDCGTNFVGAVKEIKDMMKIVCSDTHNNKIAQQLSEDGIEWRFNPPGAPHFGGLWEAGVKSTKYHLKRVVNNTKLTFEELTTLTTQIEACLNSRPLTAMSSDPNDLSPLTPGHFLIGGPMVALPDPDLSDIKEGRLSRWQLLQKMTQGFWKRWSAEFITRMQQRPKWTNPKQDITINSLVLIKDERLPPTQWRLGRVTATHPGSDGKVRVLTLRTSSGEIQRPIVKTCLLPIDDN